MEDQHLSRTHLDAWLAASVCPIGSSCICVPSRTPRSLSERTKSRVIIGLIGNFRNQLRVQDLVVLIQHQHGARGQPLERAVSHVDAVGSVESPVAEGGQSNHVAESFCTAE